MALAFSDELTGSILCNPLPIPIFALHVYTVY